MIPSELREEQLRAASLFADETAHQRVADCRDPDFTRVLNMSDQDLAVMQAKFPFLCEFSDTFIKSTPPESLLKMEAPSIKMRESERSRDADHKLAANRAALSLSAKSIKQGMDDRWSILHEGSLPSWGRLFSSQALAKGKRGYWHHRSSTHRQLWPRGCRLGGFCFSKGLGGTC